MLTNTVPDVSTIIIAQTGAGVLEVVVSLNPRQVAAGQIGRTTHQIGDLGVDGSQNDFGQLTGSLGRVFGGVNRESRFPTRREFARNSAGELSMFVRVLPAVSGQEVNPLCLKVSTTSSGVSVGLVSLFGDMEGLVSREVELGLQRCDVIGLESW